MSVFFSLCSGKFCKTRPETHKTRPEIVQHSTKRSAKTSIRNNHNHNLAILTPLTHNHRSCDTHLFVGTLSHRNDQLQIARRFRARSAASALRFLAWIVYPRKKPCVYPSFKATASAKPKAETRNYRAKRRRNHQSSGRTAKQCPQ